MNAGNESARAGLGVWVARMGDGPADPLRGGGPGETILGDGDSELHLTVEPGQPVPATATRESCGVVFDGVLYNRAELDALLAAEPGPPRNDAERFCRAYLRWGEGALRRVKGVFALVLWDARRGVLLGAHDPLGVYPLFYAETARGWFFSTSLNALVRHPHVPGAVDRGALAAHLIHHWLNLDETYFPAIRRLPTGHALQVTGTTRRVDRYWDPAPLGTSVQWIREDELDRFDVLLEEAVSRCLNDGPASIYLSGGIDSVGVATVAADVSHRRGLTPPLALSIDFPDPNCDEKSIQAGVASRLGLTHLLLAFDQVVDRGRLIELALERSSLWPWPLPHPSSVTYTNLGLEGQRHGCRVVLTGEGGDELLTVHPVHTADLIRQVDVRGILRLLAVSIGSYKISTIQAAKANLWSHGLRPLIAKTLGDLFRAVPGALPARRSRAILRGLPEWFAPDPAVRRELRERVERSVVRALERPQPESPYLREARFLLDMQFEDDFEKSRFTGLHFRHPYWDADLVDFLYRTPPELLSVGGRTKGLVRRRLERRFPEFGFGQQRKYLLFNVYEDVVLSQTPEAWGKMGGAPTLVALGLLDESRYQTDVMGALGRKGSLNYYRVWDVLNLETWLRPRV